MISRVGRVALKLRLAEADRDRADETRRVVERVVIQHALDALECMLHERYGPTTIVRVRQLSMRWQLDHETFDDPATAIELGRDLAAALVGEIEALPKAARLRPPVDVNVAVFADEAHQVAAQLADRAEGRDAWFHSPTFDQGGGWASVVARGPEHRAAVEQWLERMERREVVARWLGDGAVPQSPETLPAPAATALPAPRLDRSSSPPREVVEGHEADTTNASVHPVRDASVEEPVVAAAMPEPARATATQIAGIWYFARLVLQLDLAEQLWMAGVMEGDFLAHVVRLVVGPTWFDDPGWRWFGGAFDHEPRLEPLPAWASDELDAARSASLQRLVPDAPALDALAVELRGDPGADPRAERAVAFTAATLCVAFAARLGVPPELDGIRRSLVIAGRIELDDDIRVVMPMSAIDVDLRRAGLDIDPGHVPWLGRKVSLVFAEDPIA